MHIILLYPRPCFVGLLYTTIWWVVKFFSFLLVVIYVHLYTTVIYCYKMDIRELF